MNIVVVIPAFNESQRITRVIQGVKKYGFSIIVVDDGSKDQTYETVKRLKVIALRHKVNLGKGAALKTGCEAAFLMGAEAVIMMDSDGQHKIEDLPKFITALESKKNDVVFGSRNFRLGIPLIRFVGNKFASFLVSVLFGIYVTDLLCGYRAFTKKAFEDLKWQSSGYGIETEMVVKAGIYKLKHCEVPVETIYYDKFKGVTILDALGILLDVMRWRITA